MVDTKTKTKAAMLHELESIKGLLLEEDDIPILQEVIDQQTPSITEHSRSEAIQTKSPEAELDTFEIEDLDIDDLEIETPKIETLKTEMPKVDAYKVETLKTEPSAKAAPRVIVEEQQDFFDSHPSVATHAAQTTESDNELLNTIDELEKHTAEVTANKFGSDLHKSAARPSLAKATGENPFLPAHIRSRLHGNNPPPSFVQETARKIANTSVPSRQLGNTSIFTSPAKGNTSQQDIIDSVIDKLMPEIEKELRARLDVMSKDLLDELNK